MTLESCFATSDAPRSQHRLSSCDKYHSDLYYMTIDCILQELGSRFGESNQELMAAVQVCSPKSKIFLEL